MSHSSTARSVGGLQIVARHIHDQIEAALHVLRSLWDSNRPSSMFFSSITRMRQWDDGQRRRQARALRIQYIRPISSRKTLRHRTTAGVTDTYEQDPSFCH